MTTKELFESVSIQNEDLDPRITKKVCQSLIDTIRDELVNGGTVSIQSFGVFVTRIREQRMGINPKTKESLEIPEKRYPAFRPSKSFKEKVANQH